MNLTVKEALMVYPLSRAKLVAGFEGTSRIIKSLNTMDAPDVFDWIKDGEMLFTTAFAIKDAPEDFLNLLKKLNDRGSAGIGVKLGRYWSKIPDIVLEEANRLHFPVIELPYELSFSDQMNALFQAEFQKNTKKLHDALEKQKQLMRFAIHTQDFSNLFPSISDILAHPVVVIGSRGQILFNTSVWPEAELLNHWPWAPKFNKIRSNSGWLCRIPLMQDGDCYGYLLVMPKSWNVVQEEEGLFHQAAEILSYHMEHLQEEHQSVADYRWSLIIERYLKRQISVETFLEQMNAMDSRIFSGSYICVLTNTGSETLSKSVSKTLNGLRREIKYHPQLGSLKARHIVLEDSLLFIFSDSEGHLQGGVFSDMIARSFDELLEPLRENSVQCYISKIKPEPAAIADAYEECLEARRISQSLSLQTPVVLFADLEFNYLFSHIPREVMAKYCDNILHPLMQKDGEYIADMLKTLEAYFSNEGQINEAAKQLYIHRNTVLYRLEKMSELLSLDFRKTGDLLKMKLVFMFKHLMALEKHSGS